ncbi:MAG: DinB family protein [Dehalococcoidia bacterium]|nr:DinB family protein [Dehalococcoidia bacterium]
MERWEIEAKLNRDRAWLVETYAALDPTQLTAPATPSEHEPGIIWTALDHLAHLSGIELNFVAMVRRHIAGDANPVALMTDDTGAPRSRESLMAHVHAMTEDWARRHRGKSLSEVLALGQHARAQTLQLLSELTDAQLAETLPGAPWADGTVGAILAVHADHGRMHYRWVKDGWATLAAT